MKIIDILNKKANRELEDGFKFNFGDTYTYNKNTDSIKDKEGIAIGNIYCIENILDCKVEVIEENEEIEEKLDWEEIIGSVKKPLWDNKKKIWRVLDSYYREGDIFKISFSDTSNFERFENQELYFKEREEK